MTISDYVAIAVLLLLLVWGRGGMDSARQVVMAGRLERNPPCLVFSKQFRRRSPPGLLLEIDIGKLLLVVVAHDEAGVVELAAGSGELSPKP
jgi:hypothetical protein